MLQKKLNILSEESINDLSYSCAALSEEAPRRKTYFCHPITMCMAYTEQEAGQSVSLLA